MRRGIISRHFDSFYGQKLKCACFSSSKICPSLWVVEGKQCDISSFSRLRSRSQRINRTVVTCIPNLSEHKYEGFSYLFYFTCAPSTLTGTGHTGRISSMLVGDDGHDLSGTKKKRKLIPMAAASDGAVASASLSPDRMSILVQLLIKYVAVGLSS